MNHIRAFLRCSGKTFIPNPRHFRYGTWFASIRFHVLMLAKFDEEGGRTCGTIDLAKEAFIGRGAPRQERTL